MKCKEMIEIFRANRTKEKGQPLKFQVNRN